MRLSKEEREKLSQEILNDLPEDFSLIPPWISLFFLQFFMLLASGPPISFSIGDLVGLSEAGNFVLFVFFFLPMTLFPSMLLMCGRMEYGLKILRAIAIGLMVAAGLIFILILGMVGSMSPGVLLSGVFACGALWVSYMVKFQAFALHRQRMIQWQKQRTEKNKEFKKRVKK